MKITARAGGYSSVVGQSVLLHDETGRVVCQLALLNVGNTIDRTHKELCNEYAMLVVDAVNANPATVSTQLNARHSIEVLSIMRGFCERAVKGLFLEADAARILGRAIAEQTGRVDPSMVAYKVKDSRGDYWQTTFEGKPYNFKTGTPFTPAQWVLCAEREPTVGGSYTVGHWIGPKNGLRQFRRLHNCYFIIHENNQPTWYQQKKDRYGNQLRAFPQYWLEGMPGAPEDKS